MGSGATRIGFLLIKLWLPPGLSTEIVDKLKMKSITLELPWPPSVNNYKTVSKIVKTKTGKLYQQRRNSNETRQFYFDTYILSKQLPHKDGAKFHFREDIDLEVIIGLHPPYEKRRYDLDNRLKVLIDSLMYAQIIHDDSQITRLCAEKKHMIAHGKVVITIKEIVK